MAASASQIETRAETGHEHGAKPRSRGIAAFLLGDKMLLVALILLFILVGLALFGPLIWPKNPRSLDITAVLRPPSFDHPMGTDGVGRDVFARFNGGARISLTVGTVVVVVGALVGGLVGLAAGTSGGRVDNVLMRLMDMILAFPPLILAMAISLGLGVGTTTAAVGIIITSIPWYARLVRSDVMRMRSMPFVEASVAIGASQKWIIARHIVPHVIPTLLIQAAAQFGHAILTLAALGFVGLGAQIPTPEWGTMITEGLSQAITGRWWVGVFPGLGVLVAVSTANLLADRARDYLDPRGPVNGA